VAANDRALADTQAARALARASYIVTTIGFTVTIVIIIAVACTRPSSSMH